VQRGVVRGAVGEAEPDLLVGRPLGRLELAARV